MNRSLHWINRRATALSTWLKQSSWGYSPVLLLLFIIQRLALAVLHLPALIGPTYSFDYQHFFGVARLSDQGLYPYLHYWVEYPPIFPWLNTLLYRASIAVAAGSAAETLYYALAMTMRIGAEIATVVLIYMISLRLRGKSAALLSVMVYIMFFIPYYLWNGAFDSVPTCLFMLSILLLLDNHDTSSAIAGALGVLTKIFPGLVIPLAFCLLPTMRRKLRYVIVAAAAIVTGMLPFVLMNSTMTLASLQNIFSSRMPWETVWAVIDGNFSFGAVAPISERLDPVKAIASVAGRVPWLPVTIFFGLIFFVVYWRIWNKGVARQTIVGATVTLSLLMIYSCGYSPQFFTWLAPLIVVLFPNRRGIIYLILFDVLNVLEYPIYIHYLLDRPEVLVFITVTRTILLITLCFSALWITFPGNKTRTEPVRPIVQSGN